MNRGLIEAHLASEEARKLLKLPRFMNRGLIEAAGTETGFTGRAKLPRFMNRGLIEAIVDHRLSDLEPHDFPDS